MIQPNPEMTVEKLVTSAIEIERKAAKIYHTFSSLFSNVPKLAAYWKGLAEDEALHASLTKTGRSYPVPTPESPTKALRI
jgi:rubrerythrin